MQGSNLGDKTHYKNLAERWIIFVLNSLVLIKYLISEFVGQSHFHANQSFEDLGGGGLVSERENKVIREQKKRRKN